MADKTSKPDELNPKRFGTFGGVFTPSRLAILDVAMFLRFTGAFVPVLQETMHSPGDVIRGRGAGAVPRQA
ncbi:MAG: hypothetical protein EOM72_04830 [Opitutae bacterium]|nr:hypothetical protein [Opitutae bacterium]